jgi:hypothetical protein
MKGKPSDAQSPFSSLAPTLPETGLTCSAPALTFDPEEYRHFLADSDWTDAQKDEFTKALWAIVLNFVDLGLGVHPFQQVENRTPTLAEDSPSVVSSELNSNNSAMKDADSTTFVKED